MNILKRTTTAKTKHNNLRIVCGALTRPAKAFYVDIQAYLIPNDTYTSKTPQALNKAIKQWLYNNGYDNYIVDTGISEATAKQLDRKHYFQISINILTTTYINFSDIKIEAINIGKSVIDEILLTNPDFSVYS